MLHNWILSSEYGAQTRIFGLKIEFLIRELIRLSISSQIYCKFEENNKIHRQNFLLNSLKNNLDRRNLPTIEIFPHTYGENFIYII